MTFPDLLRRAADYFAPREAVRCGDEALTFGQLYVRSCRLAAVLADAGLPPGTPVSSLGRNRLESVEEVTGVALGGFIRSPLYTQNTPKIHAYMMERVGSRALIVDAELWAGMAPVLAEQGVHPAIVLVRGGGDDCKAHGAPGLVVADYHQALHAVEPRDPHVRRDPADIHIIRFSAGTTGVPKPIALSGRNWQGMGNEILLTLPRLDETDTELVISPFSHGSGNLVWPMIATGARQLIMPSFEPGETLRLIEQERCSVTFVVPTMIQLLVNHPDAEVRDLSSLRAVIYGAAPLGQSVLRRALAIWGRNMYQLYGQSEAAPVAILGPWDHEEGSPRLRSAGRATVNSFIRIEDIDGKVLGPGQTGEVVITGPGAMSGIYGDDAATATRFTDDGWIRTGDVGYLDEQGYLFLTDRREDLIISGGFNIWPAELENVLIAHPAVEEVVVFGLPHDKWGETPVAVVHLRHGCTLDEDEAIEWCRAQVGSVKKPARVIISAESLPKNSAGKLLRRAVRESVQATWPFRNSGGDAQQRASGLVDERV
jgi:acyl-CoA synthetase (AMP-forming)/AMP-acid ligase II